MVASLSALQHVHNHVHCLLWGRSNVPSWLMLIFAHAQPIIGISRIIFDGCKDCNRFLSAAWGC
uniref:Uncharacterized protein n=1 Tax=Aegilops tauschii TaxID=37682 RepID=M8BRX2_AEGTA